MGSGSLEGDRFVFRPKLLQGKRRLTENLLYSFPTQMKEERYHFCKFCPHIACYYICYERRPILESYKSHVMNPTSVFYKLKKDWPLCMICSRCAALGANISAG